MTKLVKVTVWVPDKASLDELVAAASATMECGAPQQADDGTFAVVFYASPRAAKKLQSLGYASEADPSFGAALEARHREVGKGDRFAGGQIAPSGLGVKR